MGCDFDKATWQSFGCRVDFILTLVLLNKLGCHARSLIFSQSDYLIQIIDKNSHTGWQTVQIQISWLLQKPTDLDLHCLQRQGSARQGFRTFVIILEKSFTILCRLSSFLKMLLVFIVFIFCSFCHFHVLLCYGLETRSVNKQCFIYIRFHSSTQPPPNPPSNSFSHFHVLLCYYLETRSVNEQCLLDSPHLSIPPPSPIPPPPTHTHPSPPPPKKR